jgi:hypothetical protein
MFRRPLAAALASLPLAVVAQEPGGPVPIPEDLLAVLTLRGKPCDRVAKWEKRGESDYHVDCADGHRYRIYVGEGDRVEIEQR